MQWHSLLVMLGSATGSSRVATVQTTAIIMGKVCESNRGGDVLPECRMMCVRDSEGAATESDGTRQREEKVCRVSCLKDSGGIVSELDRRPALCQ